jgi:hypothetical protein
MIQVKSPIQLDAEAQAAAETTKQTMEAGALANLKLTPMSESGIVNLVRTKYSHFRNERETQGISELLISALRAYRGKYDAEKLNEINKFGGSKVYSKVVASKCRSATALLRDIYLSTDRPWFTRPTPVPDLPGEVIELVAQLVQAEVAQAESEGMQITEELVIERTLALRKMIEKQQRKTAEKEAEEQGDRIQDLLVQGGFYEALADFLIDLPVFPYAVLKGPIVEMRTKMEWVNGKAKKVVAPEMVWKRISPFDIYFSPRESRPHRREIIERVPLTRGDLSSYRDLEGYNKDAIDAILEQYSMGGLTDWVDSIDSERSDLENKEDPTSQTDTIDALEFHGYVQGSMLQTYGITKIKDPSAEYSCRVWLVDSRIIRITLNPHTSERPIYYITSYDKTPGASVGQGLPEILSDYEDVMNASLRSLVNNMAMASGPQVEVNMDRMQATDNEMELYPWKRWLTASDPTGSNQPVVRFFQPQSNAQELLSVYSQLNVATDEASGIPRYMQGSGASGGAGRTASGLNMLMQNASKLIQTVASHVDKDILTPALTHVHELLALTSPEGTYKGDIELRITGVTKALQRETERMRQLEFLNITANPIDSQIVGPGVRSEILKEVAGGIGLNRVQDSMPDEETILAQIAEQQQAQAASEQAPNPQGEGSPQQAAAPQQQSVRGPSGNI